MIRNIFRNALAALSIGAAAISPPSTPAPDGRPNAIQPVYNRRRDIPPPPVERPRNRHERRAEAARQRALGSAMRALMRVTAKISGPKATMIRRVHDAAKAGVLTAAQASALGCTSPRILRGLP